MANLAPLGKSGVPIDVISFRGGVAWRRPTRACGNAIKFVSNIHLLKQDVFGYPNELLLMKMYRAITN